MLEFTKEELDSKVQELIEEYTGCEYKNICKYSSYIKSLLITVRDNCLKKVNSNYLIDKDFCYIYREVTYKNENEITGLTEKCIKRRQLIMDKYYNYNTRDVNLINKIELLKRINLYNEMLFVYETLWCLEFLKDDDTILNEEQEDIFVYLSGVAKMYLDLTDKVLNEIKEYKGSVKKLNKRK